MRWIEGGDGTGSNQPLKASPRLDEAEKESGEGAGNLPTTKRQIRPPPNKIISRCAVHRVSLSGRTEKRVDSQHALCLSLPGR